MKYEDIPKDAIVDGWVVGNDYVVEGTYKKTCQQCIHFYEREPKPWRTMADIGYCDHSREGKIEVNRNCPVNKWCDNKFEPIPVMYYPQVDGITPTVVANEGVCNRGSHIINEQYTESMLR